MPILNITSAVPETVLNLMSNEDFNFYLTGSRYFKNYTKDSDWDFFVRDYNTLHSWLLSHGFEDITGLDYSYDSELLKLYHHKRDNIHVQVVKNVNLKELAQIVLTAQKVSKFDCSDWAWAYKTASVIGFKYGLELVL